MNPDITVSGLAYTQKFSDKSGSERREVSRGAALPTVLSIKHQEYVDSSTKVDGTRSLVRFDHYMTMTDGVIRPVSLYMVLARPNDALVTTAIITSLVAQMVNLLHGATNTDGLDLKTEIFASQRQ